MKWRDRPLLHRAGAVVMVVLIVLAWAPWLTEEFALSLVVRHLGGEAAEFFYLGETMTVGEVPKTFYRLPFVAMVYFPGEAMFVVTFYGSII